MPSGIFLSNLNRNSMEHAKKLLRTFLGLPVALISLAFIGKLFFDNRIIIAKSFENFDLLLFLAGITFFSLFFLIKSLLWLNLLKRKEPDFNKRELLVSYSLSEIKRYIPGSVFAFASRVDSHSHILPGRLTLKLLGLEALLLAVSAAFLSIPALIFIYAQKNGFGVFFPFASAVILLLLIGAVIFLYKYGKTISSYVEQLAGYTLGWIFYSFGCYFVGLSLSFLDPTSIIQFLSFFILSWLGGYLLFVTPMGLGVRELILTYCLTFFTPLGIATSIAVMTRIGMIIGEFLFLAIVICLKRLKTSSSILKMDPYLVIISSLSAIYFVVFSLLSVARHNAFLSGRFDLGNMVQTVWNTAHGRFFMLTNPDGVESISRLGVHSDFILILLAPIYLLWENPAVLLIVQSFSIAIGGIFLFLLAKEVLTDRRIALAISISYFLNFWLHQQNLFDFHAVSLATSLLIAAFYFLFKKRYVYFALSLALAVITKENVFLVAAIFGAFIFFRNSRRLGIMLFTVSLLIFLLLTGYAIPNARGTEHFALSYYQYLGDSPFQILQNLIVNPRLILTQIFSFSTLNYVHELLIPSGYLSLVSPLYFIFAAPELGIYVLSSNENLRMHYYHYGALIVPFVYISLIYSVLWLSKRLRIPNLKKFLAYYILFAALVSCYMYSPLPGMREADNRIYTTKNIYTINRHLALIPKEASVSASNNIGAHLSQREKVYVAPRGMNAADYIVLYGESKSTKGLVDTTLYEEIIQEKDLNFYLYKKRFALACNACKP